MGLGDQNKRDHIGGGVGGWEGGREKNVFVL